MNGIFDSVEMKMLEELSKRGAVVGKKYFDKKKSVSYTHLTLPTICSV